MGKQEVFPVSLCLWNVLATRAAVQPKAVHFFKDFQSTFQFLSTLAVHSPSSRVVQEGASLLFLFCFSLTLERFCPNKDALEVVSIADSIVT